ncbi:MAG: ABC transporter permease [Planctomycetota bacterium]
MSSLLLIVRRSLRQHLLSTVVTILSVGLATGLTMAVFGLSAQARDAFTGGPVGFDAVLGARGSQQQLVLNTVFHMETSPGNIPWALYKEIAERPNVAVAIPYAVGDNYYGFRIVGTSDDIFSRFEYQKGKTFRVRSGGRPFDTSRREAVIGHSVAVATGLREGSTFNPYHGFEFDETQRHAAEYVVVGILEPTYSPSDRVIWIPIEGVFRIDGHVLAGTGEAFEPVAGETIADEHKEVSAVMLRLRNARSGFFLEQEINKQGKVATLAFPIGAVMTKLFDKLGWVVRVLELVAYLTMCVAAASILASIYNAMN